MADHDYKLLNETQNSMDSNMYKNGGFDSPMGVDDGGRSPPPPYAMNPNPQPYGMVSSPVNPMMMQQQQPEISHPPMQQQVHHVIMQQPQQILAPTSVGQDPLRIQCPSCREFIKSKVDRKSICKTHLCACALFLFFCWPCMCIPYCSASCRDANHSCPNCGFHLGTYKA